MDKIERYVNKKLKNAGNAKEVQNQKEELIAGLRDKISDAISRGVAESEAFSEAIASLEGMEELTEALSRKRRTVYVNRLNFHHCLITFGLIALEIVACGAVYLAGWRTLPSGQQSYLDMPYFDMQTITAVFAGLGIALAAATICPLVWGILYKANPGKVKQVESDFKQRFTTAVIGWLAVFLGLAFLNAVPLEKAAGPVIWFIWPLIGITNWPISILIYDKLFKSDKYRQKSALSGAL